MIFADPADGELKSVRLDGSEPEKLVPVAVRDYVVSSDLKVCLFRGKDGNLHSYQHRMGKSNPVWQTRKRFQMEQVAFSPSGRLFVFASKEENSVGVFDSKTRKRINHPLLPQFRRIDAPSITWSMEETKFFIHRFESVGPVAITIRPDLYLSFQQLDSTNGLSLLPCYGRVGGPVEGTGDVFTATTPMGS